MTSGPRKVRSSFAGAAPEPDAQEEAEPAPKAAPAPKAEAAAAEAPARPAARAKNGGPKKAESKKPEGNTPEAKPEGNTSETKKSEPEPEESAEPSPFLDGLAELLRSRQLPVPAGLLEAPPAAYAGQGAATVQMMARLKDQDLAERAERVAGWQARQEERARWAWDSSPLIRELRRRELPVPERPARVGAMAVSLKRPLAEWSDGELVAAVTEWTRLGER